MSENHILFLLVDNPLLRSIRVNRRVSERNLDLPTDPDIRCPVVASVNPNVLEMRLVLEPPSVEPFIVSLDDHFGSSTLVVLIAANNRPFCEIKPPVLVLWAELEIVVVW